MTNVPIWLLDVDGVINILSASRANNTGLQTFKAQPYGDARSFNITFDPTIVKRIADLHNSGEVEVQWLTTWGQLANLHLSDTLGFAPFLVAGEPPENWHYSEVWWKLPLAKALFEAGNRIIWTDDDLGYDLESNEFINEHQGDRLLALRIHPHIGLTTAELDIIEAWL